MHLRTDTEENGAPIFEHLSPSKNQQDRNFELKDLYHMTSGSEITPCIKIDKPLVVYRFSSNVMKLRS